MEGIIDGAHKEKKIKYGTRGQLDYCNRGRTIPVDELVRPKGMGGGGGGGQN